MAPSESSLAGSAGALPRVCELGANYAIKRDFRMNIGFKLSSGASAPYFGC